MWGRRSALRKMVDVALVLAAAFCGSSAAAMGGDRRYMFPEVLEGGGSHRPGARAKESDPSATEPVIPIPVSIPTTIPFVEGLTEVSFSKYRICPEQCGDLLLNVTVVCDGCLIHHQRGSYMSMAKWQLSADILIALAYFSIPIELLFFLYRTRMFPYKWVVAEFGCFIVLCGLTHLVTLWTFNANSKASFATMTFFKFATAVVSCVTAVTLMWVIPELLSVKTRELFLAEKTAQLGMEVGKIKKQEEIGRHVQMLTQEIRSSLDRHTILQTALVETSRTLQLRDCAIWMPNLATKCMELTHGVQSYNIVCPPSIPMADETVQKILGTEGAAVISKDCSIATNSVSSSQGEISAGNVAAVRLPLLSTTDFSAGTASRGEEKAREGGLWLIMVLVLPSSTSKQWGIHELELVNSVVRQVAVALSHATVVEESTRARNQLIAQNAELEQARQEVEQAMAARNEFLAVMNHEMRTPMHAIIALASLLMTSGLTEDQRAMVDTMNKSSGLLQTLIDDVLDFSKLEVGKLVLDPGSFELVSLFKEAENILRPMATNKKIGFQWTLEDVPPKVLGDNKRILQILLNVVGNAIKFTTEGYVKVTVHMGPEVENPPAALEQTNTPTKRKPLKLKHKLLHIVVEDSGVGISQENVFRLFNKFVQADSSTTRKFGGTGLGLAICKKFVELMGGTIKLESEGVGKGSTCRLCMCVGIIFEEQEKPASPRRISSHSGSLADTKVLVVDDNPINRMVTRKLLQTLGCTATVLESGPECLAKLAELGPSAFDIILLDLCMPEMDGFMVATEIIKTYGHEKRPLLSALTANADVRTRERCFETGMDTILLKPISLEKLRRDLLKLLEHANDFPAFETSSDTSGTP